MRDAVRDENEVPSVRPAEAAQRIARGEAVLVDVREAFELDLARVPGAIHIPLATLPARAGEVPRDRTVVVICHHGIRSAHATRFLRANGVDAVNLAGGIDAYAREVDPAVGSY